MDAGRIPEDIEREPMNVNVSLSFAVGAGFARLTRYKPFACNTGFWKTAE
jgi:hypothetical protein